MAESGALRDSITERERDVIELLVEGCSNKQIADRLFISVSTVKWYINELNSKLETSNRHEIVATVERLDLLQAVPQAEDLYTPPTTNIPHQTTPFIGRDAEINALHAILDKPNVRLITILAQGGMGKTRIALEIAEQQLDKFGDGVFFVPLQPLSDIEQIIPQIANSIGFQFGDKQRTPQEQLLGYLIDKKMLLLMDNFEHLLGGAALLNEILAVAPDVNVLATSREKLNLMGETVYVLQGMAYPDWETPEDAMHYDAVQLLVQAAQRVRADWEVTQDNLTHVARICYLTQGLPLAILLAASWLDVYAIDRICEELDRSSDILKTDMLDVPERQRSVRTIFENSWSLLQAHEQEILMKMSLFKGGCTAKAAEIITGATHQTLQNLVNKSWISRSATRRYEMHELMRQFAESHLRKSRLEAHTHTIFAQFYAHLVSSQMPRFLSRERVEALNTMEVDFANIQSAWFYAVDTQDYMVINRMIEALSLYTERRALAEERTRMFNRAAERLYPFREDVPDSVKSRLLRHYSYIITDYNDEQDMLERAIAYARQSDDLEELAFCLAIFATTVASQRTNIDLAEATFREVVDICREVNVFAVHSQALRRLGAISAIYHNKIEEGLAYVHKAIQIAEDNDYLFGIAAAQEELAYITFYFTPDVDYAINIYRQALGHFRELGDLFNVWSVLRRLAYIMSYNGQFADANGMIDEMFLIAKRTGNTYILLDGYEQLAILESYLGNYEKQQHTLDTLLATIPDYLSVRIRAAFRKYYLVALCGLGQYEDAQAMAMACLKDVIGSPKPVLTPILFALCNILTHHDKRHADAVAYASLLKHQYLGTVNWDIHPLALQLIHKCEKELSTSTFEQAWERGKTLDLDTVLHELLEEFVPEDESEETHD